MFVVGAWLGSSRANLSFTFHLPTSVSLPVLHTETQLPSVDRYVMMFMDALAA